MALRWRYETYRKLYVREEGEFANCSLLARSVAAYLLKLADDSGRIHLGGRSVAGAVFARRMVTRNERRIIPRLIAELIHAGYLRVDGDVAWICQPVVTGVCSERPADAPPKRCDRSNSPYVRFLREQRVRAEATALRGAVIDRDGLVCQICGDRVAEYDVHVDHIVPVSRGGESTMGNLRVTHSSCNLRKGARCE